MLAFSSSQPLLRIVPVMSTGKNSMIARVDTENPNESRSPMKNVQVEGETKIQSSITQLSENFKGREKRELRDRHEQLDHP